MIRQIDAWWYMYIYIYIYCTLLHIFYNIYLAHPRINNVSIIGTWTIRCSHWTASRISGQATFVKFFFDKSSNKDRICDSCSSAVQNHLTLNDPTDSEWFGYVQYTYSILHVIYRDLTSLQTNWITGLSAKGCQRPDNCYGDLWSWCKKAPAYNFSTCICTHLHSFALIHKSNLSWQHAALEEEYINNCWILLLGSDCPVRKSMHLVGKQAVAAVHREQWQPCNFMSLRNGTNNTERNNKPVTLMLWNCVQRSNMTWTH